MSNNVIGSGDIMRRLRNACLSNALYEEEGLDNADLAEVAAVLGLPSEGGRDTVREVLCANLYPELTWGEDVPDDWEDWVDQEEEARQRQEAQKRQRQEAQRRQRQEAQKKEAAINPLTGAALPDAQQLKQRNDAAHATSMAWNVVTATGPAPVPKKQAAKKKATRKDVAMVQRATALAEKLAEEIAVDVSAKSALEGPDAFKKPYVVYDYNYPTKKIEGIPIEKQYYAEEGLSLEKGAVAIAKLVSGDKKGEGVMFPTVLDILNNQYQSQGIMFEDIFNRSRNRNEIYAYTNKAAMKRLKGVLKEKGDKKQAKAEVNRVYMRKPGARSENMMSDFIDAAMAKPKKAKGRKRSKKPESEQAGGWFWY